MEGGEGGYPGEDDYGDAGAPPPPPPLEPHGSEPPLNEGEGAGQRRGPPNDKADDRFKVFVGGLPWALDKDALGELFRKFGELRDVHVLRKQDGRSRGFGFVKFAEESSVQLAIAELHDTEIDGRRISVRLATERADREGGGDRREGRGGRDGGDRGRDGDRDFGYGRGGYGGDRYGGPPGRGGYGGGGRGGFDDRGPPRGPPPMDRYGPPPPGYDDPRGPPPPPSGRDYDYPPADRYGPPPGDRYGPPPSRYDDPRGPPPSRYDDRYDRGPPPGDRYGPPPGDRYGPPPGDRYGSRGPPPRNERAARDDPTEPGPENKLMVGSLAWTVRESDLRSVFGRYGEVVDCRVVMDKQNPDRSKGYGFVSFAAADQCKAAFSSMHGSDLMGRPMRIQYAFSRPEEGGGGPPPPPGGGGYGSGDY